MHLEFSSTKNTENSAREIVQISEKKKLLTPREVAKMGFESFILLHNLLGDSNLTKSRYFKSSCHEEVVEDNSPQSQYFRLKRYIPV